MADAVTSQTIQDGGRRAIMKFTNVSDGTGESGVTKVDVSALTADPKTGKACSSVNVEKITYSNVGFGVKIEFDATANVLVVELPENYADCLDYSDFGGIPNNAGAGVTGDIAFSTVGTALAGDSYSVVLSLIKNYA